MSSFSFELLKSLKNKVLPDEDENDMHGTIAYGGLALTGGNVIFSTGTPDNFIYALNSINGKVIY